MTTNTPGTTARELGFEAVHFLRRKITFANNGQATFIVGTVPGGSVIVGGGVTITTAFNDSGTDLIDIGTLADPDGLATDLDASSVGFKALDELATTTNVALTVDTDIYARYDGQNSNMTAGEGIVTIMYIPNIDLQA